MMQLVERHIIKDPKFMDICVKAKNLYNQALYYFRQSLFGNIQYFSEYELTGLWIVLGKEKVCWRWQRLFTRISIG